MGFSFVPPAYPTLVRITPLTLPNWDSTPQNQPRANVAVSVLVGAEASIGGIAEGILFLFKSTFSPSFMGLKKNAPIISPTNDIITNATAILLIIPINHPLQLSLQLILNQNIKAVCDFGLIPLIIRIGGAEIMLITTPTE